MISFFFVILFHLYYLRFSSYSYKILILVSVLTLLFVSKLFFRWEVDYILDEKGFILYAFLFYCFVISFSIPSS